MAFTYLAAKAIAVKAHAGQVDKAGVAYIAHPEAVARMVSGKLAQIVAILHDSVEDSDLTLADLKAAGVPKKALAAIDAITRRPGESHRDYMDRVKANELATTVKLADLAHNTDPDRRGAISRRKLAGYLGDIAFLR